MILTIFKPSPSNCKEDKSFFSAIIFVNSASTSLISNKNIFFGKRIYIYGSGEASKNLKKILISYKIKFQKYLNEEDFVNIKNLSDKIIINNSYKVRNNKNNFYAKNKKKIIDMDVHFLNNFKNYKNYITRNYVKFIKLFNNLKDNQSKKLLISFIRNPI